MSRAPWIMLKPDRPFARQHEQLYSSTLGWRMVNPEMPDQWTISLGQSAEKLAGLYEITRAAQDQFALRSHQRAAAAWDDGFYDEWVVPVPDTELERDESIRPDTSLEKLARLKPAFADQGTVTAGNSSPLNDGAGAALLADEAGAEAAGLEPLARIVSRGCRGGRPGRVRNRARRGRERRAAPSRHRLGRRVGGRAQRGVCLAVPGRHRRVEGARPGEGQSERRRDRDRASARRLRGARSSVVSRTS